MKWIFLLLLLINLGIFGWGLSQESARRTDPVADAPPASLGNLMLLSEARETATTQPFTDNQTSLPVAQIHQEQPVKLVTGPSPEPVQIPLADLPHFDDDTPVSPAIEDVGQPEAPAAQTSLPVASNPSPPKPSSKPIATEPGKPEPSKPVSKTDSSSVTRAVYLPPLNPSEGTDSAIATNAPAPPAISDRPYPCGIIEGIRDELEGYQLVNRISALGASARLTRQPGGNARYWVLIPPLASREQAQEARARLSAVGLTDTSLIEQGDQKHAISLGVYSNSSNARHVMTEAARLGLTVEIRNQSGSSTQLAIHFTPPDALNDNPRAWQQILAQHPDLDLESGSCAAIASK